jgi:hypothetical protein
MHLSHLYRSRASDIHDISGMPAAGIRKAMRPDDTTLIAPIAAAWLPGVNHDCYPVGLPPIDRLHYQRRQHQCSEDDKYHIHGSFLSHTRPGRATIEHIPYHYILLYAFLALSSIGGKSLLPPYPTRPAIRKVAELSPSCWRGWRRAGLPKPYGDAILIGVQEIMAPSARASLVSAAFAGVSSIRS